MMVLSRWPMPGHRSLLLRLGKKGSGSSDQPFWSDSFSASSPFSSIRKLSFSSPSAFSTSCASILMLVCVSPEASSTLKTCLTATGLILVDYPKTTGRKNPLYKDNTFLLIGKSNATFSEIPSIETWVCEVGLSQKCQADLVVIWVCCTSECLSGSEADSFGPIRIGVTRFLWYL